MTSANESASRESSNPMDAAIRGLTLEQHLLRRQHNIPTATGEFTGLFQQLMLAAKIIAAKVRRAGLESLLGPTGVTNVQGEEVQWLDDLANRAILQAIGDGRFVGIAASEEMDEPVLCGSGARYGKYALVFDPLDGSGNLDVNGTTGTIFAIYKRTQSDRAPAEADLLRPSREIIAAGYTVYGSSTIFVYTTGSGVYGFTYDPTFGEFFLSHSDIRVPSSGTIYAANEGNMERWPKGIQAWIQRHKVQTRYSLRYSGAMVADVHRILLKGGVFLYPPEEPEKPEGKLRLLYEAGPMAFIARAAGGSASTGTANVVDITPIRLHQRCPLILGSTATVNDVLREWHEHDPRILVA